jgi:hypothetical protein
VVAENEKGQINMERVERRKFTRCHNGDPPVLRTS